MLVVSVKLLTMHAEAVAKQREKWQKISVKQLQEVCNKTAEKWLSESPTAVL